MMQEIVWSILVIAIAEAVVTVIQKESLLTAASLSVATIASALLINAEKPATWILVSALSVLTVFAWLNVTEEDW